MTWEISQESIDVAVAHLKNCATWTDKEAAHISADHMLLMLLPKEITEEYLKITRWYS